MDNDDFDDEFGDDFDYEESNFDNEESDEYFDPLDITDPRNAYLFLGDDAQEEIEGRS